MEVSHIIDALVHSGILLVGKTRQKDRRCHVISYFVLITSFHESSCKKIARVIPPKTHQSQASMIYIISLVFSKIDSLDQYLLNYRLPGHLQFIYSQLLCSLFHRLEYVL